MQACMDEVVPYPRTVKNFGPEIANSADSQASRRYVTQLHCQPLTCMRWAGVIEGESRARMHAGVHSLTAERGQA